MSDAKKPARAGGLGVDAKTADFLKDAAPNLAALSARQRQDRARVRVKVDLPAVLKAAIDAGAEELDTSESQLAAFLLAWGLRAYRAGNADLCAAIKENTTRARALRFAHGLEIPDDWLPGGK
jgi:hypothetical protein